METCCIRGATPGLCGVSTQLCVLRALACVEARRGLLLPPGVSPAQEGGSFRAGKVPLSSDEHQVTVLAL